MSIVRDQEVLTYGIIQRYPILVPYPMNNLSTKLASRTNCCSKLRR